MNRNLFRLGLIILFLGIFLIRYFVARNNVKGDGFEGKIFFKSHSANQHVHYFGVGSYKDSFEVNNPHYYELADTGDYIIKKKNSLYYYLVKGKDTLKFVTY